MSTTFILNGAANNVSSPAFGLATVALDPVLCWVCGPFWLGACWNPTRAFLAPHLMLSLALCQWRLAERHSLSHGFCVPVCPCALGWQVQVSLSVRYLGPIIAAHIHGGDGGFVNATAPLVSIPQGNYSGAVVVLQENQCEQLIVGNAYINLHTAMYPGGTWLGCTEKGLLTLVGGVCYPHGGKDVMCVLALLQVKFEAKSTSPCSPPTLC